MLLRVPETKASISDQRDMSSARPLEVQRQKSDRLAGGKVACAIVFDREFTEEEKRRFFLIPAEEPPEPLDFSFDGRVVRFVAPEEDEPRWRLALEIFLVKTFRQTTEVPKPPGGKRDTRTKLGLRKLHMG
jgi:hypothetical protein